MPDIEQVTASATVALLLVPAFVLAEATLSYIGLGFAPPLSSWGSMLQDAANVRAIADSPWVLSPAAAIVLVALGLNLVLEQRDAHGVAGEWPARAGAAAGQGTSVGNRSAKAQTRTVGVHALTAGPRVSRAGVRS